MIPHTLSIKNVFTHAWLLFKSHAGFLILLTFGMLLISFIFQYALDVSVDSFGLVVLLALASWLTQTVIGMVLLKVQLLIIDEHAITYTRVTDCFEMFWNYIATMLLVSVITLVGCIFFIVPGVYVALRFQFALSFVVDLRTNPIEALRRSFYLTHGHVFELLLLALVIFILQVIGLALFGLGVLVTIPVSMLAITWMYRQLSRSDLGTTEHLVNNS